VRRPTTRSQSWYLDPLVARQKAEVFLALVERWSESATVRRVLKTDLFEEANGEDTLVPGLDHSGLLLGADLDLDTVLRARRRFAGTGLAVVAADMRQLAIRDAALDLVVSPSTLDHFQTREEIETALGEIGRVLRPGGTAILIFDNPHNPLYPLLRVVARWVAPFRLGRTLDRRTLCLALDALGFDILGHRYVIHNPRGILTLVNLSLRAVLGRFAEPPIRGLLSAFAALDRWPSRAISACFVAVGARKRSDVAAAGLRQGAVVR
jgi:SAM-dependent methyltransferase